MYEFAGWKGAAMDLLRKVSVVFLVVAAALTPSTGGKDSATSADQAPLSKLAGVLHKGEKTIMPYVELEGSRQRVYVRGAALAAYESGARVRMKGVLRSELVDMTGAERGRPDAPDGLRYSLQLEDKSFIEGKPIRVAFHIENVTHKPLKVRHRPAVELIDVSNAMTARGAMVPLKGSGREPENPYSAKPSYPLKEEKLIVAPGMTATISMDLTKYYDMSPAQYTITAYLLVEGDGKDYWSGVARSEGIRFEVKP